MPAPPKTTRLPRQSRYHRRRVQRLLFKELTRKLLEDGHVSTVLREPTNLHPKPNAEVLDAAADDVMTRHMASVPMSEPALKHLRTPWAPFTQRIRSHPKYVCEVCNIRFARAEDTVVHLKGPQHRTRVQRLLLEELVSLQQETGEGDAGDAEDEGSPLTAELLSKFSSEIGARDRTAEMVASAASATAASQLERPVLGDEERAAAMEVEEEQEEGEAGLAASGYKPTFAAGSTRAKGRPKKKAAEGAGGGVGGPVRKKGRPRNSNWKRGMGPDGAKGFGASSRWRLSSASDSIVSADAPPDSNGHSAL